MTRLIRRFILWTSWLGILVAGCQLSSDVPPVAQPATVAKPVVEPKAARQPGPAPATTEEEPTSRLTSLDRTTDNFVPPFPDRVELFEPPRRAQGRVHHDEEFGETVELKGFANVDGPRVFLDIDGVISSLPEGGEKFGVQVISIQEPSVVLQRGRTRWTATLD